MFRIFFFVISIVQTVMTSDSIGCWTHINSGMYCGSHNYEHNVDGLSTVESCQDQCILEPKCSQVWFAGPNEPCTLLDCRSYVTWIDQDAVVWEYDCRILITQSPSMKPSNIPTLRPTGQPSKVPTQKPSNVPTPGPSHSPTFIPTQTPSFHPIKNFTDTPTTFPTSVGNGQAGQKNTLGDTNSTIILIAAIASAICFIIAVGVCILRNIDNEPLKISPWTHNSNMTANTEIEVSRVMYANASIISSPSGQYEYEDFRDSQKRTPESQYNLLRVDPTLSLPGNDSWSQEDALFAPNEKRNPGKSLEFHTKVNSPTALLNRKSNVRARMKKVKKKWVIDYKDLQLDSVIGEGTYGRVWKGKWKGGCDVAVKQNTGNVDDDIELEVDILASIRQHANIVTFYGVCMHEAGGPYLVMEYFPGGSVDKQFNRGLSGFEKLDIIRQASFGVEHLHDEMIVHRDLACRNLLMTKFGESLKVVVSDFGYSRHIGQDQSGKTAAKLGPVRWMAPESILDSEYSFSSDVWSFSAMAYELFTEKAPHQGYTNMQVCARVSVGMMKLEPDSQWPVTIQRMINDCQKLDPAERPSMRLVRISLAKLFEERPASTSFLEENRHMEKKL